MNCMPKCFTTRSRVTLPCLVLAIGSVLVADREAGAAPEEPFAGRWDLTISDSSNKQLPSWLELTAEKGVWKANFVGRWGNARPLPKVVIKGDRIQFVSPKEEEDSKTDLAFEGRLTRNLTGSPRDQTERHGSGTANAPPRSSRQQSSNGASRLAVQWA